MPKHDQKFSKNFFDPEIRRKAKQANQRMVRLEKVGRTGSPAYKAMQAQLELMGRRAGKAAGRRFPETGKVVNRNDAAHMKAILDKFLGAETSTVSGEKKYRERIYETANKEMGLEAAGITQEDYEELWSALPDNENDRMYYATFYIEVMQAYQLKRDKGELTNENAYSVTDLVRIMDASKSYKDALTEIGLTTADIRKVRTL